MYVFTSRLFLEEGLTTACVPQVTTIEAREDIVNGKCYCGAPKCIGTLFPRIIRDDQESGDEGGNEGEVHDGDKQSEVEQQNEGGGEAGGKDEGRETGGGNDMHMDL